MGAHKKSIESSTACPTHTCIIKAPMRHALKLIDHINPTTCNIILDEYGDSYIKVKKKIL